MTTIAFICSSEITEITEHLSNEYQRQYCKMFVKICKFFKLQSVKLKILTFSVPPWYVHTKIEFINKVAPKTDI